MKEFMKKYLNQRNRNIISIFIIIFGIGYLVNYSLFTPTYINEYIATNIYKAPANSAFDDENFYKCVVRNYNWENNTSLSYTTSLSNEQLVNITSLDCNGTFYKDEEKIVSAKGLEKLTSLTLLDVGENELTSLDVSKNLALKELDVSSNQITELDVSNNTALTKFDASKNQLSTLDVSKNAALTHIDVSHNKLSTLDVSKNTALTELNVRYNQLTNLDVSNNTSLTTLRVDWNKKLTTLDVSKNSALTYLNACYNQLTELDVSKNTALTKLDASYNQLTTLDVSKNAALTTLKVNLNKKLTTLDLSGATSLKELDVSSNQITSLDVSKNAALTKLDASFNQLTTLDVSKNTVLTKLHVRSNQLTSLDVSKNTVLNSLNVSSNQITSLDVSKNTSLTSLSGGWNKKLTTLDVSKNSNLEYLDVENNQLTTLDVSKNTALTELHTGSNQLTSIDLSKNLNLEYLDVSYNQLTSLDVSKNLALECLLASYNNFDVDLYVYVGGIINGVNKVKAASETKWSLPTWESENTDVVTVSNNGKITSLKSGNIKVNATVFGDYGFTTADSYTFTNNVHVIEITSDKYKIDDNNIYVFGDKDINTIKNNLNIPENITIDIDLNHKKLYVKHGDDIIKEFNLVMLNSDKYQIYDNDIVLYNDLDINTIKKNITINSDKITLESNNNKLILKHNEELLKEYNIVSYSSDKYDLSKDSITLLGETNIDLDSINTINCTKEVIDNKLVIKYKNNIIKEFNIMKGIEFGNLRVSNHSIVLDKNTTISYKEFTDNITTKEGYSYKIYNDNNIVNDGNIVGGMVLKVYYNEEEVDSYNITYDYVEFSKDIVVDNHNNILEKVKHKTTVDGIRNIISTNGNVSIFDKNNNKITDNSKKLGTGYKVRIEGSNQVYEYLISVKGDSTGDGEVNVRDIVDVANTIVKNRNLDRVYYSASDYREDNTINVRDIVGIANYIVNGK